MDPIAIQDNNLLMVGDTHSINTFQQIVEEKIPDTCLDVFHVGDLGVGFSHKKDEKQLTRLGKIAEDRGIYLYAIRGNHDDPAMFPNVFGNLFLLSDYTILVFPNKTRAMCVGGGISIDRCVRRVDDSYWVDEITPFEPEKCELCEFVFMHDAPSYFNKSDKGIQEATVWDHIYGATVRVHIVDPTLIEDCHMQRDRIDQIVNKVKPKMIIGGHFHNSTSEQVNGVRYRCLDINELYDFDSRIEL